MPIRTAKLANLAHQSLHRWLPAECAFCRCTAARHGICRHCSALLPGIDAACERCGRPLAERQPAGVCCADCQRAPPPFDKARAPYRYAFPVDSALKAIKFDRDLAWVPVFAALLVPVVEAEFSYCDALWPVPLHRWRQMRRGFNQAYELCRPLARHCGLRILCDSVRSKATLPQSGLSAARRRRNLLDAFTVPLLLRCRDPLIVDDVMTTGATVAQLARVLRRAGARSVSVLTVAVAA